MPSTRKLAAIFYADVAGYSRLTGADEEGSHADVIAVLDEVTDMISKSDGEVLRYAGDAILAQFESVVQSVRSAVEIQQHLTARNAHISQNKRIEIRIGINLGDVIVDRGEIFGEGVNIAARLEALAPPGGVCISGTAQEHVGNRVQVPFRDLGFKKLKNIEREVQVWQWTPKSVNTQNLTNGVSGHRKEREHNVLPQVLVSLFTAQSSQSEDAFLADAITEDLIARISRSRNIAVLSRYVTFEEGVQSARNQARELNAAFLIEGSVRRSGKQIRINAKLVDVAADAVIWSERYDGTEEEIFELQDKAAWSITGAIEPELLDAERSRHESKAPDDLSAWQIWQRGFGILWKYKKEDYPEAVELFREAIKRDGLAAPPHAGLAYALVHAYKEGVIDDPLEILDTALEEAKLATRLDPKDPISYVALGRTHLARREYEPAMAAYAIALDLNPSQDTAHMGMGYSLCMVGRAEEALRHIDMFDYLTPSSRHNPTVQTVKSFALSMTGRYEDALDIARKAAELPNAPHWAHVAAAFAHAQAGRPEEAQASILEAKRLRPTLGEKELAAAYPFVDGDAAQKTAADLLSSTNIFRQRIEGLPEQPPISSVE